MGNIDANLWTNVPCNETKKAIGTNEKYHFIFIYIITCKNKYHRKYTYFAYKESSIISTMKYESVINNSS